MPTTHILSANNNNHNPPHLKTTQTDPFSASPWSAPSLSAPGNTTKSGTSHKPWFTHSRHTRTGSSTRRMIQFRHHHLTPAHQRPILRPAPPRPQQLPLRFLSNGLNQRSLALAPPLPRDRHRRLFSRQHWQHRHHPSFSTHFRADRPWHTLPIGGLPLLNVPLASNPVVLYIG